MLAVNAMAQPIKFNSIVVSLETTMYVMKETTQKEEKGREKSRENAASPS